MRLVRDPARPLLLDGAIGTELGARGLRFREEAPESWNLTRPDEVRAVHAAYAAAGSEAVQTNTFGLTAPRLGRFGLAGRQREIADAAVRLARLGAPNAAIIGSLGPTGETIALGGRADIAPLREAFAAAAAALAAAGVDAIHLETQFHPAELQAAIEGARAGAPNLPLIASMALMPGATGLETPHGVPIGMMMRALEACLPDAVGANCAVEAERMLQAVTLLREKLDLPVWAKPQAKLSDKCATGRSSETPEKFARHARALADAGAAAIGGCCGTTAASIAALRAALDHEPAKVAS
ncbi:MAG TPA: homocysteine S-methyltransferase family protein [Polyangia bacterium]